MTHSRRASPRTPVPPPSPRRHRRGIRRRASRRPCSPRRRRARFLPQARTLPGRSTRAGAAPSTAGDLDPLNPRACDRRRSGGRPPAAAAPAGRRTGRLPRRRRPPVVASPARPPRYVAPSPPRRRPRWRRVAAAGSPAGHPHFAVRSVVACPPRTRRDAAPARRPHGRRRLDQASTWREISPEAGVDRVPSTRRLPTRAGPSGLLAGPPHRGGAR